MVNDSQIAAARDCLSSEISGCYNCQPWDGGGVFWLGGSSTLEEVFSSCDIDEDLWEEVLEDFCCPYCGTDLQSPSDDVEIKSEYDKKVEATIDKIHSPGMVLELHNFHKFLASYPYLGLGDDEKTGLKIRERIKTWPRAELSPAIWYRARKLNDESRIYDSTEMGSPKTEDVFVSEGRYNHTGQSFLYLADKPQTAFREIRTSKENICAMQMFQAVEPIRVLDLRKDLVIRNVDPNADLLALAIIYNGYIQDRPSSQTTLWKPEYFVPRYIADCARLEGFEGIWFSSAVSGNSSNLVVFDKKKTAFVPKGESEVFVLKEDDEEQQLSVF